MRTLLAMIYRRIVLVLVFIIKRTIKTCHFYESNNVDKLLLRSRRFLFVRSLFLYIKVHIFFPNKPKNKNQQEYQYINVFINESKKKIE